MARRRAIKMQKQGVRFVSVPTRDLVTVEADITDYDADLHECMKVSSDIGNYDDKVVKLRVRYRRGDEEAAHNLARNFVKAVEPRARHIYKTEFVAVGERKVRMKELKPEVGPTDAARLWMDNRPPVACEREDTERLLVQLIECVDVTSGMADVQDFIVTEIVTEDFVPFRGAQVVHSIGEGVFGVVGEYIGADGKSNRAGKSALFEAVLYALYGEARKARSADAYTHHGAERMAARVALDTGDDVERRWNGKSASVYIGGERHKVRDAQVEIDGIIGLGVEDFMRTCFVRQGDLHGVLGQGSAQIKSDLMRWLGLDVWKAIERRAADGLSQRVKLIEKTMAKREAYLDQQFDKEQEEAAEERVTELQAEVAELEKLREDSVEAEGDVIDLKHRVGKAEEVEGLRKVAKDRAKIAGEVQRLQAKMPQLQAALDMTVAERDRLVAECDKRKKYVERFDGVYPVDGEDCPRTDEINKRRTRLVAELKAAEAELSDAFDDWKEKRDKHLVLVEDLSGAKQRLSVATGATERLEDYDDNPLAKLKAELKRAQGRLDSSGGLTKIDTIRKRDELARLRAGLVKTKELDKLALACTEEIGRLEEEAAVYRYVRFMSGKHGIPSMQVENAMETIEGQANTVLAMMGADHRVEFCFETELKRKADVCYECGGDAFTTKGECVDCGAERGKARSDELTVRVRDAGRQQSFDQDSGGGKALLAFAVRVALARFLGCSVLFLDEIDGSLDDENLRLLVDTVAKLPELGFRQVFLIDHRPEVAEAMPRNIVVTRHADEGWSEVVWK